MPKGYKTFGPEACGGRCPLWLEVTTVCFLAGVPVACLAGPLGRPRWAALLLASVTLPRVAWRPGSPADGPRFQFAVTVYMHALYAAVAAGPLTAAWACAVDPWRCGPLLAVYVAYAAAYSPERRDSRPWREFAKHEWGFQLMRRFFPLNLHVSDALPDACKAVVFAVHPHGVVSDFRLAFDGMLYDALPGRNVLTLAASVLFKLPVIRELVLWTRCIDASRPVAERALAHGHSVLVIPGGEREQIRTTLGKDHVSLPSVGFVRLAMKAGCPLVPCYVFGNVDLYRTYSFAFGLREWLRRRFQVCLPLFHGAFGLRPRRKPLDVVFGPPLALPCASPGSPSQEEVVAGCLKYTEALRTLYDEHKAAFGFAGREISVELPEDRKR